MFASSDAILVNMAPVCASAFLSGCFAGSGESLTSRFSGLSKADRSEGSLADAAFAGAHGLSSRESALRGLPACGWLQL